MSVTYRAHLHGCDIVHTSHGGGGSQMYVPSFVSRGINASSRLAIHLKEPPGAMPNATM